MPVNIYTTLDDPMATNGTSATAINTAGQIVGNYSTGVSHEDVPNFVEVGEAGIAGG